MEEGERRIDYFFGGGVGAKDVRSKVNAIIMGDTVSRGGARVIAAWVCLVTFTQQHNNNNNNTNWGAVAREYEKKSFPATTTSTQPWCGRGGGPRRPAVQRV
jgi:hypothetical protein